MHRHPVRQFDLDRALADLDAPGFGSSSPIITRRAVPTTRRNSASASRPSAPGPSICFSAASVILARRALGVELVLRPRVLGVVDAQVLRRDRLERLSPSPRPDPPEQVLVEPVVHHLAGHLVVVVPELRPALGRPRCRRRRACGRAASAPAGPSSRSRSVQSLAALMASGFGANSAGDLDVAGADAQVRAVLADAAALHRRGHHDGRERGRRPVVDARRA